VNDLYGLQPFSPIHHRFHETRGLTARMAENDRISWFYCLDRLSGRNYSLVIIRRPMHAGSPLGQISLYTGKCPGQNLLLFHIAFSRDH